MALTAGTVSIANDGTVTGTGLAKAIGDAFRGMVAAVPGSGSQSFGAISSPGTVALINGIAAALVNYITANAEVTVTIHTTDAGLQTSSGSGSPTTGPAADKVIIGTVG